MNDQQRAAMIRPRGKSEAPHMIAAYRAMQMALEALIANLRGTSGRFPLTNEAITALREALENNELVDVALINEGNMAQPQVAPDGRVAKTVFTFEDMQKATEMGYESGKAEAEALAQPQSEPVGRFYWESIADGIVVALPSFGTPYFEKDDFPLYTTPQVTPQGEPVAWRCRDCNTDLPNEHASDCLTMRWKNAFANAVVPSPIWVDLTALEINGCMKQRNWFLHQNELEEIYAVIAKFKEKNTPPSSKRADALVEAAIEATKEKAAKVCEELFVKEGDWPGIDCRVAFDCAAAIRSMK